jgi:hypothetical protein
MRACRCICLCVRACVCVCVCVCVWKSSYCVYRQQKALRENSAGRIQRVFRGYVVRKAVAAHKLHLKRVRMATKIQCTYRMYVCVQKVLAMMLERKRRLGAICIQRMVRGMCARNRYHVLKQLHKSSLCIQCAYRCYRARCVLLGLVKEQCAAILQRVYRGHVGRLRAHERRRYLAEMRAKRLRAIVFLTRYFHGYSCRRKHLAELHAFKFRRQVAACVLQMRLKALLAGLLARRYALLLRTDKKTQELARQKEQEEIQRALEEAKRIANRLHIAATVIQRVARGRIGRRRALTARKHAIIRAQADYIRTYKHTAVANRVPVYWRLQGEYVRTQNLYHRPYVVKIQCRARMYIAKRRCVRVKLNRAAFIIQINFMRMHLQRRAVKEVARRRRRKLLMFNGALLVQSTLRRYLARRLLRR